MSKGEEKEKQRNRLLNIENKRMATREKAFGEMGETRDEHWVSYGSIESLCCITETNITLLTNEFK